MNHGHGGDMCFLYSVHGAIKSLEARTRPSCQDDYSFRERRQVPTVHEKKTHLNHRPQPCFMLSTQQIP